MNRRLTPYIIIFCGLIALSAILLRTEFIPFIRWYLVLLLMGFGFYPFTMILFGSFEDRGWIFSKTIAIAFCGYITFLFVSQQLQQLTSRRCIVISLILFGFCWVYFLGKEEHSRPNLELMLLEEILFLGVLLMWTYICCFRPEAYGTEKFMDYGFLVSMERSLYLPAKDMWYGLAGINYYYGGQYFTVFLSKVAYLPVRYTYNLMRATIGAFAFVMPFSIVYHMLQAKLKEKANAVKWSLTGGAIAGAAVSLAGNVHYVLYGLFGDVFKLQGYESYWFPSSTRYIGHNPDVVGDQCIHEFPSYSFVLGDLHAHMINIIFVLTIIGLLYCWVRNVKMTEQKRLEQKLIRWEQQLHHPSKFKEKNVLKSFLSQNGHEAPLILAGGLIGLCKFTNYWDFIIYFTVTAFVCVVIALFRYYNRRGRGIASVIFHMAEVWLLSVLIPLPFTLEFENTVTGVGLASYHTAPYQLAVLWGLPTAIFILFMIVVVIDVRRRYPDIQRYAKENNTNRGAGFLYYSSESDRFALVLGICALGLILIPEIVYVRDIYEEGYSRANTMFKLTYQAYILFGIFMGYALVRLFVTAKNFAVRILSLVLTGIFALTLGYFPYAVSCWFGDITDRSRFVGLDATTFIYSVYPEDAGAIDWLRTYVKDQPLVLEASGDSYSDYCRVSAMTGLPTLEGWYVHEWLWRGNPADLDYKDADIRKIYEAEKPEDAQYLMARYGISYLFVGSCEHEKYAIQDDVLQQVGEVIYKEGNTYIVQFMTEADNGSF